MNCSKYIDTPLGLLLATASEKGICGLSYTKNTKPVVSGSLPKSDTNHKGQIFITQLEEELSQYFQGKLKEFTIPLDPAGTEFQLSVWNKLQEVKYGTTVTYAGLAEMLDSPNAVRAVGGANSKNPIMILVPCHRVNGANGKLTGYSGGLYAKKYLLELESGKRSPVQTVLMFP